MTPMDYAVTMVKDPTEWNMTTNSSKKDVSLEAKNNQSCLVMGARHFHHLLNLHLRNQLHSHQGCHHHTPQTLRNQLHSRHGGHHLFHHHPSSQPHHLQNYKIPSHTAKMILTGAISLISSFVKICPKALSRIIPGQTVRLIPKAIMWDVYRFQNQGVLLF